MPRHGVIEVIPCRSFRPQAFPTCQRCVGGRNVHLPLPPFLIFLIRAKEKHGCVAPTLVVLLTCRTARWRSSTAPQRRYFRRRPKLSEGNYKTTLCHLSLLFHHETSSVGQVGFVVYLILWTCCISEKLKTLIFLWYYEIVHLSIIKIKYIHTEKSKIPE